MKRTMALWLGVVLVLLTQGRGWAEPASFRDWLETFRATALAEGITNDTWDNAFAGVTEPDPLVLQRAAYQPEFTLEPWEYIENRVTPEVIAEGRRLRVAFADILEKISDSYGVKAEILLAIWSMESNYGTILQRRERLHYVPTALATLGWGDARRSRFGRTQLLAALYILQAGDVTKQEFLGSWAGAMGHTQFIPTSYLAYGVDFDGNGKRDIWSSVPDALATAASLLAGNGWRSGLTWGYEVVVPKAAATLVDKTKTLGEWQQLGFVRPAGKGFPRPTDKAVLKLPAGSNGPGFLMLRNFFVIKRYNNSDLYALSVGLLADRLSGWSGLVQHWPRPPGSLTRPEKLELQRLLRSTGYYEGEVDGILGEESRTAIRQFQRQQRQKVDGKADVALLQALRRQSRR